MSTAPSATPAFPRSRFARRWLLGGEEQACWVKRLQFCDGDAKSQRGKASPGWPAVLLPSDSTQRWRGQVTVMAEGWEKTDLAASSWNERGAATGCGITATGDRCRRCRQAACKLVGAPPAVLPARPHRSRGPPKAGGTGRGSARRRCGVQQVAESYRHRAAIIVHAH